MGGGGGGDCYTCMCSLDAKTGNSSFLFFFEGSCLGNQNGGWILAIGSAVLFRRQNLQNSSSVFLLKVVGSIGRCWPRWTRRTWSRQLSTGKRTVDSVQGVGRTDTSGMGRRHHNVDELDALEQGRNSLVASRGRRTARKLTFLRQSGARSDRTRT